MLPLTYVGGERCGMGAHPMWLARHGKGAAGPGFVPSRRHDVRTPHGMIPAMTHRPLTSAVSSGWPHGSRHTASRSARDVTRWDRLGLQ
jgi:hypothetical protein